ncbi:MAG: CGNR zinc finger domain-containing protein [Euzebyales bacterium]|nr:CGNR zinc finger domain-containing protein [Euzebyales bacterium]
MALPVDLDPGSYDGTYKLIGGALALDFANLVSYRGTSRHHDWLEPASNAERWRRAVGLHAPITSGSDRFVELRELLAGIFLAVADGTSPAPAGVDRVGRLAAHSWTRRTLRLARDAHVAAWTDPAPSMLDELVRDAASLLTSGAGMSRVAACEGCRWVFLDATRNRSRRWCDPADCGNRARQRRHYQRRRRT